MKRKIYVDNAQFFGAFDHQVKVIWESLNLYIKRGQKLPFTFNWGFTHKMHTAFYILADDEYINKYPVFQYLADNRLQFQPEIDEGYCYPSVEQNGIYCV